MTSEAVLDFGTGLILPSSTLLVLIERKKFFFSLIDHERNKVPESLFGLQLDPDSRAVRCPHGLRLRNLRLQSAGLGARLRTRARGPAAQPGLRRVPR